MPKNALQQCLNSHVISAYLESRAARKAAAMDPAPSRSVWVSTSACDVSVLLY